jgi:hypothetical protein
MQPYPVLTTCGNRECRGNVQVLDSVKAQKALECVAAIRDLLDIPCCPNYLSQQLPQILFKHGFGK